MDLLNLVLAIVLLFALIKGFINGFVKQIFSIAGIILGILLAYMFAKDLAFRLTGVFSSSISVLLPLSYLAIFLLSVIACNLLGRISHNLVDLITLGGINRIAGAVVSTLKYAVIAGIILNLYANIDSEGKLISMETRQKAMLYNPLLYLGERVLPYVDDIKQLNIPEKYEKIEDFVKPKKEVPEEAIEHTAPEVEV